MSGQERYQGHRARYEVCTVCQQNEHPGAIARINNRTSTGHTPFSVCLFIDPIGASLHVFLCLSSLLRLRCLVCVFYVSDRGFRK